MKKLFYDDRGISNVAVIMFVLLFVIATTTVVTYFQAMQLHEGVQTALNRSVNAAIQLETPDDYRREALMNLDVSAGEAELRNQLATHMNLDSQGVCRDASGKALYKVTISSVSADADAARMTVAGIISVPVAFFGDLLGEQFVDMGFRVTSRNQRIEAAETNPLCQHPSRSVMQAPEHPHASYYECDSCGAVLSQIAVSNYDQSCPVCNPAECQHPSKTAYQATAHPHASYCKCDDCGEKVGDIAASNYVSSCTICNPPPAPTPRPTYVPPQVNPCNHPRLTSNSCIYGCRW